MIQLEHAAAAVFRTSADPAVLGGPVEVSGYVLDQTSIRTSAIRRTNEGMQHRKIFSRIQLEDGSTAVLAPR
jgi:hypothetical protein